MLTEHFRDVHISGHDAGTTPFVRDERYDFVIASEGVEDVMLDGGEVGCGWAVGSEELTFVDELMVEAPDDAF